jgi:hypothetical protein
VKVLDDNRFNYWSGSPNDLFRSAGFWANAVGSSRSKGFQLGPLDGASAGFGQQHIAVTETSTGHRDGDGR